MALRVVKQGITFACELSTNSKSCLRKFALGIRDRTARTEHIADGANHFYPRFGLDQFFVDCVDLPNGKEGGRFE